MDYSIDGQLICSLYRLFYLKVEPLSAYKVINAPHNEKSKYDLYSLMSKTLEQGT